MSIRIRLVIMCLVVSLLPAIPLSFLVQSLLEKSFNVGLNRDVEEALQSGLVISREHLDDKRAFFEEIVEATVSKLTSSALDSAAVAAALSADPDLNGEIDGFLIETSHPVSLQDRGSASMPENLKPFVVFPVFVQLIDQTSIERRQTASAISNLFFYETTTRSVQLALWRPSPDKTGSSLLFYKKTDPGFLDQANNVLTGRQTFAQLRLAQRELNRSFFYPFIIVYAVILLLSLGLALLMAERLANPIRRLVHSTRVVASGDWSYRLKIKAGGEPGRLVEAFNRMVAQLDRQHRRLIDMEKMAAWREIARRLAHEIKNPLLPIRLTIQELKDQYRGDDKSYGELLSESTRVIDDELNSLQNLVKEFSSFARMPELSPRMGSLQDLAGDVAKLYPQVETKIKTDPALLDFAFDPDQMRRVLVNLFDNSIAAIGEAQDGKIHIVLDHDDENARFLFKDNGRGISAEFLPKIFEPYFTSRTEGTGLGLAMVKNIILLHGGSIEADSVEGQGTTFTIRIPMVGGDNGPPAARAQRRPEPTGDSTE